MSALRLSSSGWFARRRVAPLARGVPAPRLEGFTDAQIAFAARAWTMRAEEEHHSAAVFADMVSLLVDADVPLDLLATLNLVVADELRHAELCTEVAARLRTTAPRSRPLPRGEPPRTAEERRARGLDIVLVEGAIGETISSALFAAGRRAAEEPCTRAALSCVLRDEVLHARTFWEALDALRCTWTDADRARLHARARSVLGALERDRIVPVMRRLERGEPFDPAWAALGVLAPERRVEAFYGAVERRVVPRLDRLGLEGARAWSDRYR